jgi:tripartite-type tricarboxylate transporter receptor subunit TctC
LKTAGFARNYSRFSPTSVRLPAGENDGLRRPSGIDFQQGVQEGAVRNGCAAVKPVQLIVPYPQGGGSDQRARLLARHLARHLAEPVEVVNRTGAVVGHQAIADAPPDGSVIGQISGEIGMMHWHRGLTRLTPADYTPLAVPYVESAGLIVKADAPWRSAAELIAEFRSRRLMGSGGPDFSIWKLALAGLLVRLGVSTSRLEWTATLSGEQGLANVLAGKADVAPITMTDARTWIYSGEARALTTMESERHSSFPDVPTIDEALGVAWHVSHWRGIVGPRGLPAARAGRYVEALRRVAADRAFQEEAAANAFTLRWRFGEEFARYMEEEDRQFGDIIHSVEKGNDACVH